MSSSALTALSSTINFAFDKKIETVFADLVITIKER